MAKRAAKPWMVLILLAIGLFLAFQAGCGGTEGPQPPNPDLDGDGIPDFEDLDADGDGVKNDLDCDDLDAAIAPGKPDRPDASGTDSNCDGTDGDAAAAVWASSSEGDDAAAGTMAAPVRTIVRALELAVVDPSIVRDVYVVAGIYAEDVELASGSNLYGGYGILVEGARARDVVQHVTAIAGVSGDRKRALHFSSGDLDADYTLLVAGEGAEVDGFTILGDASGIAVIVAGADAEISRCTVIGSKPLVSRDLSAGILALALPSRANLQTVVVEDSTIEMKGTGERSSGIEFGIFALQEKDADAGMLLRAERNRILGTGASELAFAIVAADADADPRGSSSGDGAVDIEFEAFSNDIRMEGEHGLAAGVVGGSVLGAGPLTPEPSLMHLGRLQAIANRVVVKEASSIAIGIAAGFVRHSSLVANNAVRIEPSISGSALGLVSVLAPLEASYNSFSLLGRGAAMGALFGGNDVNAMAAPYAASHPGGLANNIFEVAAVPGEPCVLVGLSESTMGSSVADVHIASPRDFKHNDLFLQGDCSTEILYRDIVGADGAANDVASIEDLEAREGFLASDPMEVEGNLSADPLFEGASAGKWTLQDASPCRDSGLELHGIREDMLGTSRPAGAGPDIGAYEQ